MALVELNKKSSLAGNDVMSQLHSQKQKVVARVRNRYLKKDNKNPDCFMIGSYIGVYLELATEDDEDEMEHSEHTFIKDKQDNYYAAIAKLDDESD